MSTKLALACRNLISSRLEWESGVVCWCKYVRTPKTKEHACCFAYRLWFDIWVYCDVNSYGPDCGTYCVRVDNDEQGHTGCHPDTGERFCLDGKHAYDSLHIYTVGVY